VTAAILVGTGDMFVTGADIKILRELDRPGFLAFLSTIQEAFDEIEAMPLPTLAALNGHAMGGGLEFALACDIRFAAEGIRLGLPEVKLGLLPGAGGTQRLLRAVGKGRALELLYTGRSLPAEEAQTLSIVERVVPRERLLSDVKEFAAELARGPGGALRAIKRCVLDGLDGGMRVGRRAELREVALLHSSPDAQEGLTAFIEKRPPGSHGERPQPARSGARPGGVHGDHWLSMEDRGPAPRGPRIRGRRAGM